MDGGETSLQDILANGPAVLAFFKVTCPVCQLAFPFLDRIHSPGALPVYGVSQNDSRATAGFIREYGIGFPVLLDEEDAFPASNAFGISTVPTMFVIATDGTISNVIEGWQKNEVAALGKKAGVNPFRETEYVPEWKAG
jgi:peroxiredoxin